MKTGIQISSLKPLLKTPEEVTAAFAKMAALGCRYGLTEQETWDTDPYECLGQALAWLENQK